MKIFKKIVSLRRRFGFEYRFGSDTRLDFAALIIFMFLLNLCAITFSLYLFWSFYTGRTFSKEKIANIKEIELKEDWINQSFSLLEENRLSLLRDKNEPASSFDPFLK